MSDHKDEVLRKWLTRGVAAAAGALATLALVLGFFVLELKSTQRNLKDDENKTCEVQARGLPASRHLSASMRDIIVFLHIPGTKDPPMIVNGAYNPLYFALMNLRKELPQYVRLTSKQPRTRDCS